MKNLSLNELAESGNNFAIVRIDETHFWKNEIAQKAQQIDGVYLVNLKEPTNLCELSVSYPATFIKNHFKNVDAWDDDEITNFENENGGDDFSYFSGNSTPKFVKFYEDETEEEAIENEAANPSVC